MNNQIDPLSPRQYFDDAREVIPSMLAFFTDGAERTWMKKAACRGMDTNIWFPEKGETTNANIAMQICQTCPVIKECGEYGAYEKNGIWGGLPYKQRRKGRSDAKTAA